MIRLVGGAHSDVGRVRTNNQDSLLSDAVTAVYTVADGMGGHRGGEVASALALDAMADQLSRFRDGGALRSVEALVDAVLGANERVFDEGRANAELFGMGTTLSALALVGEPIGVRIGVVNVGDSRVYRVRDGELVQLTEDHSLVQSLVRDGQLTADEAAIHPQRNILTRVIGVEPDVEVDWWEEPVVVGDRYLLCSDGLFNEVSDSRIAATLRQLADPTEAAKALVALANAGGGRDNVTCVVVDVIDQLEASAPEDPGPTAALGLAAALADPPVPIEPRPRRFTVRVAAFVLMVLALVGVAAVAIRTWARHSYFVAASGESVAIFRGRPDGVLWFDPEVVETSGVALSALTELQSEQVRQTHSVSSLDEAHRWITTLTAPTTTTPAPTTTAAPTSTLVATVPTTTVPATSVPAVAPTTVAPLATPVTEPPAVATTVPGG